MGKLCLRANNKDGVSLCYTYIDVINYKFIYILWFPTLVANHNFNKDLLIHQKEWPHSPTCFPMAAHESPIERQGARALGSLSLIPSVHPSVYP